jgi:structural maintenance of chromosome 1
MTTALKKSKERFETEMSELGSSRDMSGKESDAAGRISGLERKIQYVNADMVRV